jgi:hypothetical protein
VFSLNYLIHLLVMHLSLLLLVFAVANGWKTHKDYLGHPRTGPSCEQLWLGNCLDGSLAFFLSLCYSPRPAVRRLCATRAASASSAEAGHTLSNVSAISREIAATSFSSRAAVLCKGVNCSRCDTGPLPTRFVGNSSLSNCSSSTEPLRPDSRAHASKAV